MIFKKRTIILHLNICIFACRPNPFEIKLRIRIYFITLLNDKSILKSYVIQMWLRLRSQITDFGRRNTLNRKIQLASIPIVAAAVGYITNYVGVSMLFYPIEYRGTQCRNILFVFIQFSSCVFFVGSSIVRWPNRL